MTLYARQISRAPTAPARTVAGTAATARRHRTALAEASITPNDLHPLTSPDSGVHAPKDGQTTVASDLGVKQLGHTIIPALSHRLHALIRALKDIAQALGRLAPLRFRVVLPGHHPVLQKRKPL